MKKALFLVMLIPLVKKSRLLLLILSLALSIAVMLLTRSYIRTLCPQTEFSGNVAREIFTVLFDYCGNILFSAQQFFSLRGLHNLANGFAFFLLFAIIGFAINRRQHRHDLPAWTLLILPITLFHGLISTCLGRMFFPAFVVVIPYTLIFIETIASPPKTDHAEAAPSINAP